MKKILLGILTFTLAFGILSVSFLHLYSPSEASNYIVGQGAVNRIIENIDYEMPYEGKVLPDSNLWFLKVVRDRTNLFFVNDDNKKSELNLLYSDKRLMASKKLFSNGKPDIASATLTKGEKYLESSLKNLNNINLAKKIALASLKHRQIIEQDILPKAPDDLKPGIIKTLDYSKSSYKVARDYLNSKGEIPPKNPFND